MLFNLIVIGLVLVMTSYLASQGTLTALLGLVAATFASLAAMAFYEPLVGLVAKYKPEYARGVTFLLVFLIAYLVLKLCGDNFIPKNIKLPKHLDRGLGGVIGFFAGMLTVGTTVLGVEMLPLRTGILGYDRFGSETGMKGATPGVAAQGTNVWLAPENFTMGLWNMASGRSLGGSTPFPSVHPNLADESYGIRNVVQYGQLQTLYDGLKVTAAALVDSKNPELLKRLNVPEGKVAYVVRCEITKGTDGDAYFRVTPTAVRLVTKDDKQYFPIGYLEKGTKFVPTPLDSGAVADDEPSASATVEEWVFQLNPGELPQYLAIKGLSRVDVAAIPAPAAPLPALAAGGPTYPAKPYKADEGTVVVKVTDGNQPLQGIRVMLIRTGPQQRDFPLVKEAYELTRGIITQYNDGSGGWKDPVENNAYYPKQTFENAQRMMRDVTNSGPEATVLLRDQLPYIYIANTTSNPNSTAGVLDTFTKQKMIPTLEKAGSTVINEGDTDASGTVTFEHSPKGNWVIFAGVKIQNKYYMWCPNVEVKPKETTNKTLDTGKADFKFPSPYGGGGGGV